MQPLSPNLWHEDARTEYSTAAPRRRTGKTFLFLFLLLAATGGGIYVYSVLNRPVGASVAMSFETPPPPLLGETFPLTVSLVNQSEGILLYAAKLSLFLPEDVAFVGEYSGERVHDEILGTLGPGSVTQRTINVVALGQARSVRNIRAKFTYATAPDSRVQFEQDAVAAVQVGEEALTLSLETPNQVVNGVPFTLAVKYRNASNQEFKNVKLVVRYPGIFEFQRATLEAATRSNNVWNVGTLKGGAEGKLSIDGAAMGPEGSFFTLGVSVSADYLGESRELVSQTASLGIASSPISVRVSVNGASDYIARIGDSLRYTITYRNNSSVVFRGVMVQARPIGTLFNYQTVRSQASFNSLTNTLTWITANAPELEALAPGEEHSVSFEIGLKRVFPIARASDKNYTFRVEARVESATVPPDTAADRTVALGQLETKVGGAIALRAKALWRDAAWGIVNEGPYPPRANQPTQFTIHWLITNSATDASGVRVEAYLQSGAKFIGNAKSAGITVPQYDAATGRVTWTIPSVSATKGIVGAPLEGVFQVEVLPAITSVGQSVTLLGASRLTATDIFTNLPLESSADALTTDIPEDMTVQVYERRVQP